MPDIRPDPNELLKKISQEELNQKKGKLKIFFGYAAGVGKTYAMLEAAHLAQNTGIDVVAGYIEPHSRPETSELLQGLEILPYLHISRKGIALKEFDLDAAIKRHPSLILVDELAHTNTPGSRNTKRYQDIQELLRAGINVYTTVNVQHIESLHDMVYQITKVKVNERIPDKILDNADKIELVDIEPDDLIERLNKGKVYKNAQAKRALQNFFTKENLVSLREIALRRTADQVNKKSQVIHTSALHPYYIYEHILICLSSSPTNAKVIRTAARMSSAFHGRFTALFVETPATLRLSQNSKALLRANLKLAETLGAQIITVYGENVPIQIAEYAKLNDVSKIVIGRSNNKKTFFSSKNLIDKLTQFAPNLDIYIIPDYAKPYTDPLTLSPTHFPRLTLADTLKFLGILIATTLVGFCFYTLGFNESNIITIYILSVLFTATCTQGFFYSMMSSLFSVLIFNFCFTVPRFSLVSYDSGYPITFIVMFISALLTSSLTMRIKTQAKLSALKAKSTSVLLETSQKLQKAPTQAHLYSVMGHQTLKLLNRSVIIYPVRRDLVLAKPLTFFIPNEHHAQEYLSANERAVAEWVLRNNKHAGATTSTLSNAKCLSMAIRGQNAVYAVISIAIPSAPLDAYEENLLIAMLGEFGLSLEKKMP